MAKAQISTTLPRFARSGVPAARWSWREIAVDGSLPWAWEAELERWLAPFLARLRRKAQRQGAPFYPKGLVLPGERKSIGPLAARVAPADTPPLPPPVSAPPPRATAPLEDELARQADRLVGGDPTRCWSSTTRPW